MSKWSQDQYTRYNVSEMERKEKRYIESSLHPSIYTFPPIKNLLCLPSPYEYDYSHMPKLLPLFVTSDKGKVSSRHLVIAR